MNPKLLLLCLFGLMVMVVEPSHGQKQQACQVLCGGGSGGRRGGASRWGQARSRSRGRSLDGRILGIKGGINIGLGVGTGNKGIIGGIIDLLKPRPRPTTTEPPTSPAFPTARWERRRSGGGRARSFDWGEGGGGGYGWADYGSDGDEWGPDGGSPFVYGEQYGRSAVIPRPRPKPPTSVLGKLG